MPTPSAHIVGVHPKGQLAYTITTSPKAPTANDKMTVKVKFANYGMDEGAIGKVAVWIRPVPQIVNNSTLDWVASRQGGYYEGGPCAYKNYQFFADFSDVVLQPGKSKTVTLTKVPVPETAGWWQLSVVPDIDCVLPATKTISPAPAFASFEVVA
ncbi:hypothetical protein Rsub_00582 [Raphidocelis subcapitata]|uniref:Uncharacterized protein n=1 Tax=Raphidocelis subcapitata TaxID=307507 RepID=A0A2V0NQP6_9CHLO|nr:hypothetical protein Rsub_00582 [Raphidocelis subcapitata]|eukprot:GBF87870.1 hypothetical protein Rsub_00582 [Raphidocelis subcapitata]